MFLRVMTTAEALTCLENTVCIGHIHYPFLATHDWFLDPLRGSARFRQIMEKQCRRGLSFF